jgi:hypothetical protein
MNTIYDVDYFLSKFSNIDENDWIVGSYIDSKTTKKCALGHCGETMAHCTNESESLLKILPEVDVINDGRASRYQQPTPKLRILAALQHVKRMQQPKPAHIEKSRPDLTKQLATQPVQERLDVVNEKEVVI